MADENTSAVNSAVVDLSLHHGVPQGPLRYECTLSPKLIAKAREELQEKPEWRLRDVQALRDMILKEHPNLRTRLEDAFLLRFLRARKFDYDRALQLFVNYHSGRRSWPELFDNLKPSAIKPVLDSGFVTVLPHPDPDGRRIICIQPGRWIPRDYPVVENLRALYLTLEKLIQSEETQDGFPVRIKAVNIINEPRIFKGIFAVIKPFLKEKITNRFFLHGSSLNSLHKNVPRSILPEVYGGTAGTLDTSLWNQTLLASEEEFVAEFCQSRVTDDELLEQHLMSGGEPAEVQREDLFRGAKSQLYYCY